MLHEVGGIRRRGIRGDFKCAAIVVGSLRTRYIFLVVKSHHFVRFRRNSSVTVNDLDFKHDIPAGRFTMNLRTIPLFHTFLRFVLQIKS